VSGGSTQLELGIISFKESRQDIIQQCISNGIMRSTTHTFVLANIIKTDKLCIHNENNSPLSNTIIHF